jgi:negative regulator of genetic competence, sporulation and motility
MYMGIKNDSRLYFYNGKYSLLLISGEKNGIIRSVLREYGSAEEISKLKIWLLDEHAETIFQNDAVKRMAECFT